MKVFHKIKNGYEKFLSYYSIIGALWIAVIMLVITADVVSRTFFRTSLQGTPEIVANSIVAIAFMQFAYCLTVDKHVRTTIIYDKLNERNKLIFDLFSCCVGLAVFSVLVVPALDIAIQAFTSKEYEGEGALRIPTWPTKSVIFLGYATLTIEYVLQIIDKIMKLAVKERGAKA